MGDTACENSKGFQLLRLQDLLFHLFALGDVAEAPYPSEDPIAQILGAGISFKYAPVFETQDVDTLFLRPVIKRSHFFKKLIGMHQLIQNIGQGLIIITRRDQLIRDAPQFKEPLIPVNDRARIVNDEDAVIGRFQGGPEKRNGLRRGFLGALSRFHFPGQFPVGML